MEKECMLKCMSQQQQHVPDNRNNQQNLISAPMSAFEFDIFRSQWWAALFLTNEEMNIGHYRHFRVPPSHVCSLLLLLPFSLSSASHAAPCLTSTPSAAEGPSQP